APVGSVDWPLNKPPASTAQNPLGWEPFFPEKAMRRRADLGLVDAPLFPQPAASAALLWGFEPLFPPTAIKRPTGPGWIDWPLNQPPPPPPPLPGGMLWRWPLDLRPRLIDGRISVWLNELAAFGRGWVTWPRQEGEMAVRLVRLAASGHGALAFGAECTVQRGVANMAGQGRIDNDVAALKRANEAGLLGLF